MTTKFINNNIIEIEEVDESWALKLMNEAEQDAPIEVEEDSTLNMNEPSEAAPKLSAIELQILHYEQNHHSDEMLSETNSFAGFKHYLKRIFA